MPFVSPSTSMFASSRSHILSTPRTLTTSQQASLGATSSPNRNYDSLATNVARQPIATHATKLRCWVTPNDHCHKVVANDNQGFFFHGLAMLFGLATFLVIIASTFWRKQFGHRDEVALTPLVGEKGNLGYLPADAIAEIQEVAGRRALSQISRVPVEVPQDVSSEPILTSFLHSTSQAKGEEHTEAPVVLLHGFDSNCLEWRAIQPLLKNHGFQSYAFDILGWGFTERHPEIQDYSPEAKRIHFYNFWKQHLGSQPMILVGASIGGAMAIDFALEHPEAVEKLVLVAPQCFVDGVPPLPGPLAKVGIQALKSKWLRMQVTKQAYNIPDAEEVRDAMLLGRLHCLMDRYDESAVSFIQSGGYSVSKKVSQVSQPTLVLWGRQDQILAPEKYLDQLKARLPNAEYVWIEDSGHVPHCIQPEAWADAVVQFLRKP
uniref:AB hydrolase-1 domain-containing protein n=1 Tax=Eutreptiella gymnastica TaxID=73025 RepID=A0A7S4GHZ0_9EUGL|eukprot:CAMPEP_0174315202 /NCGR_PEP_ID=MMETSP0810-20121108/6139_1 /TAXON_ID=73025 ORGANISM="Eutreptiella gymnastica-like, Strain CCMP1594" /NCGR_SAMPLE_ID=MMETSP0810 /ASSEMBLY_ACC=CAM_ASM_000659 /LENGTH=432 /DNA_ID=CAMNT_0015424529 /DNA_START=120 /DNA_END=1418 /DNA_ORIENTATION=+